MSYEAAVLTISDKGYRGERVDTSGPAICAMLEEAGYTVSYRTILPDEAELIRAELIACADMRKLALVLTTGGTGFSPRDVTPEATLSVIERETRGIPEAMRWASLQITPRGCLSRAAAGIRGRTLIVNLPGSERAAKENLAAVLDALGHGLDMLYSSGSADCGEHHHHEEEHHHHHHHEEEHHRHHHEEEHRHSSDGEHRHRYGSDGEHRHRHSSDGEHRHRYGSDGEHRHRRG